MLRERILTLTAVLVAGALATATVNDSVTLKRVVKVGDVHTWKLNVDMDFQGTEVNITADITEEVLKVNEDGSFTVTELQENQVIMMAGAEQAGPEAPAVNIDRRRKRTDPEDRVHADGSGRLSLREPDDRHVADEGRRRRL